jgi:serine/threonine-protein kinase
MNMQSIVPGYELQKQIGVGGFSDVYQAIHLGTRREVALKLIAPSQDTPEYRQRFEAEADLTARLEHPQIVPVYDFRMDLNVPYVCMRWIRGGTLADLLASNYHFSLFDVVHVTSQIASALQFVHQWGVVHQDIKPSNILLDEAGNAYLTDFGIAYDQTRDLDLSVSGNDSVLGSPSHMAPERIMRRFTSPQTDIYSLGIMLYEMLAGKAPFQHADLKQVWRQHLYEPMPLVAVARQDISDQVDRVIQRATRKEPNERFLTAGVMAAELQQIAGVNNTTFASAGSRAGADQLSQPTRVFQVTQ